MAIEYEAEVKKAPERVEVLYSASYYSYRFCYSDAYFLFHVHYQNTIGFDGAEIGIAFIAGIVFVLIRK